MSRRKPAAPQLTKAGAPRKRAVGAGRPPSGRTACPPRILPTKLQLLKHIAQHQECTLAEAIELAASVTTDVIMGLDPRRRLVGPERARQDIAASFAELIAKD